MNTFTPKDSFICTQCGFVGNPRRRVKGNVLIELILWLCFIVPGLIYSLWRLTSRYSTCPNCGHSTMIPIDSPMGQKLIKEVSQSSKVK